MEKEGFQERSVFELQKSRHFLSLIVGLSIWCNLWLWTQKKSPKSMVLFY